jgi:hypothetical protein
VHSAAVEKSSFEFRVLNNWKSRKKLVCAVRHHAVQCCASSARGASALFGEESCDLRFSTCASFVHRENYVDTRDEWQARRLTPLSPLKLASKKRKPIGTSCAVTQCAQSNKSARRS